MPKKRQRSRSRIIICSTAEEKTRRRSRSATTDHSSSTRRTTAYLSRTRAPIRRLTSHGLVGHRSYNVSTKSTTSCVGCLRVRTWHTACISVAHGTSLTKGFRCVDLRNFFIPTGQTMYHAYKDRHRPTSQRVVDVQQTTPRQPDRRRLHTLVPQPGPHHSGASQYVQSATRILPPSRNSLSC